MGTWNTKINGNDAFMDIYQNFFERYNQGGNLAIISKQIQDDFTEMFNDYENRNNSLLGLALAQWETKSLAPEILKQVKEIIQGDNDISLWRELGADQKVLSKRKAVLDKFLNQISTERDKPKRRIRPKFEFEMIELISVTAPDNKKKFRICEEYVNKKYVHTSGTMEWGKYEAEGVFHFTEQGKYVSVKWADSQTLEVTHEKGIAFTWPKNTSYYMGDEVSVIYIGI